MFLIPPHPPTNPSGELWVSIYWWGNGCSRHLTKLSDILNGKGVQAGFRADGLVETILAASSFCLMAWCNHSQTFPFVYLEHKMDNVYVFSLFPWNSWGISCKLTSLHRIKKASETWVGMAQVVRMILNLLWCVLLSRPFLNVKSLQLATNYL